MQLALNGLPGETITGIEEVKQIIRLVLTTPARSVPLRDDLDSKLYEFIDRPVTHVRPLIIAETHRLLDNRIPGFKPEKILVETSSTGNLEITIKGVYEGQGVSESLELRS